MWEYEDIRYAVPPTAPRPMPRAARAAQFAPFAAVVGHEAAVEEAARLTERQYVSDEGACEVPEHARRT